MSPGPANDLMEVEPNIHDRRLESIWIDAPCPACGTIARRSAAYLNQIVTGPCGHSFVWNAESLREMVTTPPPLASAFEPAPPIMVWGACGLGAVLLVGGLTLVASSGGRSSDFTPLLGVVCLAVGLGALVLAAFLARSDPGGRFGARFGLRARKRKPLPNLATALDTARANFAWAKAVAKDEGPETKGQGPRSDLRHLTPSTQHLTPDPRHLTPSTRPPTVVVLQQLQQRLVCLFAAHGYRAAGDNSVGGTPPNPRSVGGTPPNPGSVGGDEATALFQKDRPGTLLRYTLAVNQMVSPEELDRFFGLLRDWVRVADLGAPFVVAAGPLAGTVVEQVQQSGTGWLDPRAAAAMGSSSHGASKADASEPAQGAWPPGFGGNALQAAITQRLVQLLAGLGYKVTLVTNGSVEVGGQAPQLPGGLGGLSPNFNGAVELSLQKGGSRLLLRCNLPSAGELSERDLSDFLAVLKDALDQPGAISRGQSPQTLGSDVLVAAGPLSASLAKSESGSSTGAVPVGRGDPVTVAQHGGGQLSWGQAPKPPAPALPEQRRFDPSTPTTGVQPGSNLGAMALQTPWSSDPTDTISASMPQRSENLAQPGGSDELRADFGLRTAFALAGLGWHAVLTPVSGEMLAHLERNGARAIARFPIPAGENLSPFELERLFLSLGNELVTPSTGLRQLLSSGPFAGASITFMTDASPSGLRPVGKGRADAMATSVVTDPPARSEALLQRDLRPSQVLGVGSLAFPSQRVGTGPALDFFRRYGTLCLLIHRDPYPVPLAEARAFLLERGLIDSSATSVLRFLVQRPFGPNPAAKVQEWLDSSPEATHAKQLANAAMQDSRTLDEYIAKLRTLLGTEG